MKILMMTNTYLPIVGGLERSIQSFSEQFRKLGHEVIIVTPDIKGATAEEGVIRIPAIQKFNGTDFSVNLPIPGQVERLMHKFSPDIVHAHHPFLIGDFALRLSRQYQRPVVFTYHTMYEQYVHYLPLQNDMARRFVSELSMGFANLTDQVIVPSESVRKILITRGVLTPMDVIPTGIAIDKFAAGEGQRMRVKLNIPRGAFVVGYVGRLAQEKNPEFLARAVAQFLEDHKDAYFLLIGQGPSAKEIEEIFKAKHLSQRLITAGVLESYELIDAYHAMDVFAFASQTETQGLVIAEAFACRVPVVAVDATGVRDVVKDEYNGRLISNENLEDFVAALSWVYNQPEELLEAVKKNARETANYFSLEYCANRMLEVYQRVKHNKANDERYRLWQKVLNRIRSEWHILKNIAEAGHVALSEYELDDKFKVKNRISGLLKINRALSCTEWAAKFLGLSKSTETETRRGLVMIQVDGFSGKQFQKALDQERMPFLSKLLTNQNYKIHPMYSGLPSSTPAVQGELFYGIKHIVPSFAFYDARLGRIRRMYDGDAVREIEQKLAQQGEALLKGGSSYSNIYAGGGESHFCASSLGWEKFWKEMKLWDFMLFDLMHIPTMVRVAFLIMFEAMFATFDAIKGIFQGENPVEEIKFIPTRLAICVLLRELVTLGVRIDISRGLEIIHVNFIGYDEQAHRRGPSSEFAHWALAGIDYSIERIYKAALRSTRRSYDVWIYSDHGQEDAAYYTREKGKSLKDFIEEICREFFASERKVSFLKTFEQSVLHKRLTYFGNRPWVANPQVSVSDEFVFVTLGPTADIHLTRELSLQKRAELARKIIEKTDLWYAATIADEFKVKVWTKNGEFVLPDQAKEVFAYEPKYWQELAQDMMGVVRHPDSGTLVLFGWRTQAKPYTFVLENGAHGSIGAEEINAFAMLPSDAVPVKFSSPYLRAFHLRELAFELLNRHPRTEIDSSKTPAVPHVQSSGNKVIRVLTYNVHSCIGMDGKISPERIARVIGRHQPDIVALQELDMRRDRTRGMDQPHVIANYLEMLYHFHPTIRVEEEQYGEAILSRFPMKVVRAQQLPLMPGNTRQEPRGAIWSQVEVAGIKLQFLTTHLGLQAKERFYQVQHLLGKDWLHHPEFWGPAILCGDLNAFPGSSVCREIGRFFKDAQMQLERHKPRATWFSHFPVGRIDHVFVTPDIKVLKVAVSATDLDKLASDHLPLIVDLQLP